MTTYLFGSNYTSDPIAKCFETEDEAFDYSMGMTDGPDRLPIWKIENGKLYIWSQSGFEDGKWVWDDQQKDVKNEPSESIDDFLMTTFEKAENAWKSLNTSEKEFCNNSRNMYQLAFEHREYKRKLRELWNRQ